MQLQKTSTFTNLLNFLLFIFKAPLLCANHCFLTLKTVLHSNVSDPKRKNFVLIITQLSEVEIRQGSELL